MMWLYFLLIIGLHNMASLSIIASRFIFYAKENKINTLIYSKISSTRLLEQKRNDVNSYRFLVADIQL